MPKIALDNLDIPTEALQVRTNARLANLEGAPHHDPCCCWTISSTATVWGDTLLFNVLVPDRP